MRQSIFSSERVQTVTHGKGPQFDCLVDTAGSDKGIVVANINAVGIALVPKELLRYGAKPFIVDRSYFNGVFCFPAAYKVSAIRTETHTSTVIVRARRGIWRL
jgi:hypothetical protein